MTLTVLLGSAGESFALPECPESLLKGPVKFDQSALAKALQCRSVGILDFVFLLVFFPPNIFAQPERYSSVDTLEK